MLHPWVNEDAATGDRCKYNQLQGTDVSIISYRGQM